MRVRHVQELRGRPVRRHHLLWRGALLPDARHARNPDGLPVGFAKGKDREGREWFGFSCAACHTGQISYGPHTIRVDGGTTLADVQVKINNELVPCCNTPRDRRPRFDECA